MIFPCEIISFQESNLTFLVYGRCYSLICNSCDSAKLRSRQKERLAQRNAIGAPVTVMGLPGLEPPLLPSSSVRDSNRMIRSDQPSGEESSAIDLEDNRHCQNSEAPKTKSDLDPRLSKLSKHKMRSHLDFPVKPFGRHSLEIVLPGHQHHLQGTSFTNSMSTSNLLPVLGLCAPNANQMESSERNIPKSHSRHNRKGSRPGFPFEIAPLRGTPNETDVKPHEPFSHKFKLPSASLEALQHGPKNSIPDIYLPVRPNFLSLYLIPPSPLLALCACAHAL